MYLMVCTQLDIAFDVVKVSMYMSNPRKMHQKAVKWILKYLNSFTQHGLYFDVKTMNVKSLLEYVNAKNGGNLNNKKSTTGYVFNLTCGCVSWRSSLQKCISLSSTEAYFVASVEAS